MTKQTTYQVIVYRSLYVEGELVLERDVTLDTHVDEKGELLLPFDNVDEQHDSLYVHSPGNAEAVSQFRALSMSDSDEDQGETTDQHVVPAHAEIFRGWRAAKKQKKFSDTIDSIQIVKEPLPTDQPRRTPRTDGYRARVIEDARPIGKDKRKQLYPIIRPIRKKDS